MSIANRITVIVGLSLISCAAIAHAFIAKDMSTAADKCLLEAKTGGAVSFCLGVEQATQENRVDVAYAKQALKLNGNRLIDFRITQTDWQRKRRPTANQKAKELTNSSSVKP